MKFDHFQTKSIEHINNGCSVIVSAPTGAGKTVIAEEVIKTCLESSTRCIYTAPVKALSNQKFRDFAKIYPDKIGILTGDVTINAHAPILIMTTEIFRNKLLTETKELEEYSWIIFDEIHYLDDPERGTVWEESLIFMPEHMRMLGLSATIPNIDELAGWLRDIHNKDIEVVQEDKRPVPLHCSFQQEGKFHDNLKELKKASFFKKGRYFKRDRKYYKKRKHLKPNRLDHLIAHLIDTDRLPAIYFCFSRKRCEYLAREMRKFDLVSVPERNSILELYDELLKKFDLENEKSALEMRDLVKKGVGYHHAGMLPTLKEVIERLFTSRLIKIIFTTETFALGINMPARTVIFDELRKFHGTHFGNLKTRDFYQMAGRAGRRGIDPEGFVYSRINPNRISFNEVRKIIAGNPEKVLSRFNASYATLLNLFETYKNDLYEVYPRSFHCFQKKPSRQKKALEIMRRKVRLLKKLGYIQDEQLTEKGLFASRVYGYELIITELYYQGLLKELTPAELGVIASAAVFEPRKRSAMPRLSERIRTIKRTCDKVVKRINLAESNYKLKEQSKPYYFHLSVSMLAWVRGEDLHQVLKYTDADEGGLIRNFRMAVQILRELLDTPVSEELKNNLRKAITAINRDVIDAEKQLREI